MGWVAWGVQAPEQAVQAHCYQACMPFSGALSVCLMDMLCMNVQSNGLERL